MIFKKIISNLAPRPLQHLLCPILYIDALNYLFSYRKCFVHDILVCILYTCHCLFAKKYKCGHKLLSLFANALNTHTQWLLIASHVLSTFVISLKDKNRLHYPTDGNTAMCASYII
jgi:hypothetical protein